MNNILKISPKNSTKAFVLGALVLTTSLLAVEPLFAGTATLHTRAAAAPRPAPSSTFMETTEAGKALRTLWASEDYRYTPKVREAFLTILKQQTMAKLKESGRHLPKDFLDWVDSDPIVRASIYGNAQPPEDILCVLYSLDQDLGSDVVRKEYTQFALAMAVTNFETGSKVDLTPRKPIQLVIPTAQSNPWVNTLDANRKLDVNDHIINFLEVEAKVDYEVKIKPEKAGDPVKVEKHSRPLYAKEVFGNPKLQAQFTAYMAAKGHPEVVIKDAGRVTARWTWPIAHARGIFLNAYLAKGRLAQRDATPTLAESCAFLIRNDRYRFKDGRNWPIYPLQVPWPALTGLAHHRDPLREVEEMWQQYVKTGRVRDSIKYVGNVAQNGIVHSALFLQPYNFGYGSLQMSYKDGGVCGAQSGAKAYSRLGLGQVACTYATTGHCGFVIYHYNKSSKTHRIQGGVYMSPGQMSDVPFVFSPERPLLRLPHVYHHQVLWATNYDFAGFIESNVAFKLFCYLTSADQDQHGTQLIESGLDKNPYNAMLAHAIQKCSLVSQLHLIEKLKIEIPDRVRGHAGCPARFDFAGSNFHAQIIKRPIPEDAAEAREIYAYIRNGFDAKALLRYQAQLEGIPFVLSEARAKLNRYLNQDRTSANWQGILAQLQVASSFIKDPEQRKSWLGDRLDAFKGKESFFYSVRRNRRTYYRIQIDPIISGLCKTAGIEMPSHKALVKPAMDELTAIWKKIAESSPEKVVLGECNHYHAAVQTLLLEESDRELASAWRDEILTTIAPNKKLAGYHAQLERIFWKISDKSNESIGSRHPSLRGNATKVIDLNPRTAWHTSGYTKPSFPQYVAVDLGEVRTLNGFTLWPNAKNIAGSIEQFALYTSMDGKVWTLALDAKVDNTKDRSPKQFDFTPIKAHYFKFVVKAAFGGKYCYVPEIGVKELR